MKTRLVIMGVGMLSLLGCCGLPLPLGLDSNASPTEPLVLGDNSDNEEFARSQNVTLYVSNQSFALSSIDIQVYIDDGLVVDQNFEVLNQHNWIKFPLALETGEHRLFASTTVGDASISSTFVVTDQLWAVLDFWHPVADDAHFTFEAYDEPIVFQ
ncbi:MAG: hypothetical protein JXB07_16680 [Anaerolineae bacterium]|nr:hypothetical protein [Anaerolineae bacterium]